MKNPVHVQVNESKNKRRLILESAKSAVYALQDKRSLVELQQEKQAKTLYLKKLLQQAKDTVKLIDLPDVPGFTAEKQYIDKEREEKRKETQRKSDDLLSDLEEIEKKLNSL